MIKALIIGCGKIAGKFDNLDCSNEKDIYGHASAYRCHPGYEISAFVDIDLENAKYLADKYQVKIVSDDYLSAIEKTNPDVVSICTPDHTHFDITKRILSQKNSIKIIFLEKPACQTDREYQELIELSKQRGIPVVVNHSRRFQKDMEIIRNLYQSGGLGDLVRVDAFYYGGWEHNGTHLIDTILYLLELELKSHEINRVENSPYKNDPNLDVTFVINDKVRVCLNAFDESYYQLFEVDLKFEKARIRIEDFGDRLSLERREINEMSEHVLVMVDDFFEDQRNTDDSRMFSAVSKIEGYIKGNDSLDSYTLPAARQTLEVIWQVKKAYEARFKQ